MILFSQKKIALTFVLFAALTFLPSIKLFSQEKDNSAGKQEIISNESSNEGLLKNSANNSNLVAAKVNGVDITKEELDRAVTAMKRAMEKAVQMYNVPEMPMERIKEEAMNKLIASELIIQKAKSLKIVIPEQDIDAEANSLKGQMSPEEFNQQLALQGIDEKSFRQSVVKSLYIRKLIMMEIKPADKVSEKELKETYEKYKDKLTRMDDSVRLSHIFINFKDNDTEDKKQAAIKEIENVKAQLDKGASWKEMVEKYSKGPKDNDGDLGFISVKAFDEAISKGSLPEKVGGITNVIKRPNGLYLFKLTDKKEKGGILSLEEAKPALEKSLLDKMFADELNKYVDGLKKNAKIEILDK